MIHVTYFFYAQSYFWFVVFDLLINVQHLLWQCENGASVELKVSSNKKDFKT